MPAPEERWLASCRSIRHGRGAHQADGAPLGADLELPLRAFGVVAFASVGTNCRFTPAHQRLAARLRAGGVGTLLLDLLTMREQRTGRFLAELRSGVARGRVVRLLPAPDRGGRGAAQVRPRAHLERERVASSRS
jgi:hypothetical protein